MLRRFVAFPKDRACFPIDVPTDGDSADLIIRPSEIDRMTNGNIWIGWWCQVYHVNAIPYVGSALLLTD